MQAPHGAPGPVSAGRFLPAQATAQMVIGGFADGYSDACAEANTDTMTAVMAHQMSQSAYLFFISECLKAGAGPGSSPLHRQHYVSLFGFQRLKGSVHDSRTTWLRR